MNTEPIVVNNTLDVTGNITLDVDQNGVILGPTSNQVEVPEPSPVDVLLNAQVQATLLVELGADSNIRYAAKKAEAALGRLLRDMERHRRIVGGSH